MLIKLRGEDCWRVGLTDVALFVHTEIPTLESYMPTKLNATTSVYHLNQIKFASISCPPTHHSFGHFLMQAEEAEHLISELARVTGGERALIEECGDQLSITYNSQVCYILILFIIHYSTDILLYSASL